MTQHQTCVVLRSKRMDKCDDCKRLLGLHVHVHRADKLIRCCPKCALLYKRVRIITKGMITEIANHIVIDGYGSLETSLQSKVEEIVRTIERVCDERDERRASLGGK